MKTTEELATLLVSYAEALESGHPIGQASTVARHYREAAERIQTLEIHVRELRDSLEATAHPEQGWPLTLIADRFEASRRSVPTDLAAEDRIDPDEANEQAATDWHYRERVDTSKPIAERDADHQTVKDRAAFLAREIQADVMAGEAEIAAAIDAEIRRFMFSPKRKAAKP